MYFIYYVCIKRDDDFIVYFAIHIDIKEFIHLEVNLQLKPRVTFGFSLNYKCAYKDPAFYEGHSMQQKSFLYWNYMVNPVVGHMRILPSIRQFIIICH